MSELSHVDEDGHVNMVDVSEKKPTKRTATARSTIYLPALIMAEIKNGEIHSAKGAVFQTATIAGIMAAKKTGDLIPLCHPLGLDHCNITIDTAGPNHLVVECTATITAKTGIEMEALTGASIAALTIYDMCKAMSHDIVIQETKLMSKTGGKSDYSRK
ncbi:MAG: cyclic pyranopterin monophosphate synthase MoaC [Taibaiella sp.]|nr:cyclic pyranopterin monophosphate synthase MoaC [Taibaiella sp.]